MKKIASFAVAAVLLVGTLVGCGTPASTASKPASAKPSSGGTAASDLTTSSEAVNFSGKLMVSIWDQTSALYFGKIEEAFEKKYPDVDIEYIDTPSGEYNDKLTTMLNGGSAVDVFMIRESDTSLNLYNKGQVEVLNDYIKKENYDTSVFNGLQEIFKFDGNTVALPVRTDYYIMYYNKDIFDAAKVDYPTNDMTWKEFEETAKKITAGSGANKSYGAFLMTWQAMVQNWAVQEGEHTMMGPDYAFFKPYYKMALRMQSEGTIQDFAALKSASIHYNSAFQQGNVGMLPMGTWAMGTTVKAKADGETDINWGIATLPHPENVPAGSTLGATTPICINPASTNKDLAWEFIKFFAGEEGAAFLAEEGQIPARTSDAVLASIANMEGMPEGAKEALKVTSIIPDRPIVPHVAEVNKMLEEEHGLIMLGEMSIDDGLAAMGKRSKEIQGS